MKKSMAVIEIASNELRLKIGEKKGDSVRLVESISHPLSLGKDTFHNGKISFESICKTAEIINGFLQVTNEYGVERVETIATTAVREATNREYVLDQLKIKTGLNLSVADDSREKNYINTLMFNILPKKYTASAIAVHLGSGNISISLLEKNMLTYTQTIKTGGLRLSEMFEAVGVEKYSSVVREYLRSFIDNVLNFIPKDTKNVILTGADVELMSTLCGGKKSDGVIEIAKNNFGEFYKQVKEKSPTELEEKFDVSVDKQEVILPAVIIYNRILKYTGADKIFAVPITAGDMILLSMLNQSVASELEKHSENCAITSAWKIAERFQMNIGHLKGIEKCALMIFDRLKKIHGLNKRERFLLEMTVILHNVGKFINPKAHYKHSYHIINGLDISGVDDEERLVIATAALYHGSIVPDMKYEEYRSLTPEQRVLVAKLCAVLRLAVAVDSGYAGKYEDISVNLRGNELIITLVTFNDMDLEKWTFDSKSEFFEDVYGIRAVLNKRSVI